MPHHLDHNAHVRHHVRSHLANHVDDSTLLILEELLMSAITPLIDQLVTKVATLKSSNDALTAAATEKDIQINDFKAQAAAAQAALVTAQANAFDPADVQKLQDVLSSLV